MSGIPSGPSATARDADLVAAQLGRRPRLPWRVAARCAFSFPTVIVSPSVLTDGSPFPNFAWLTCPHLSRVVADEESAGAAAAWAARAAVDPALAQRLFESDAHLRAARAVESGGEDACASVGLAGQRDPLGVKCLHAHVALALVGINDPIGVEELGKIQATCGDARCRALQT